MPENCLTRPERRKLQSCHVLLRRRRAYLAAAVLELGRLHFDPDCRTAAITMHGPSMCLSFNRAFFDELRVPELAAVLVHESLHIAFAHPKRLPLIRCRHERALFSLACEAVINDNIKAHLTGLPLPGDHITGPWLVGRDTSGMTAEDVMCLLKKRDRSQGATLLVRLPLDDHAAWEAEPGAPDRPCWDAGSARVVDTLMRKFGRMGVFGTLPLGLARAAATREQRAVLDLTRFLVQSIRQATSGEFDWTRPSRRLMPLGSGLILPVEKPRDHWHVLMALDASGSIPAHFLSAARTVAIRPVENTRVELISFDTAVYPVDPVCGTVKGGGGTCVQCVEMHSRKQKRYPDMVFAFTDGMFPRPELREPQRWVWILPPWGISTYIPPGGRIIAMHGLPEQAAV